MMLEVIRARRDATRGDLIFINITEDLRQKQDALPVVTCSGR
jgi:hypothetical protein